ncbi:carboxylesterase family protein [Streptomyces sp. NBC_00249]|uniref:carboxylesterase/lipase family protein n=1 Tax=Streptomyces sp. NBC_00249 TaxID=2975690 RepID=UPI002251FD80|nr:carboxylesterase family protein [Streptomyces sp. NBC_00249]MCX5199208.1 carboxylesterase family protein [Streptomyces sp. NBC_00249]
MSATTTPPRPSRRGSLRAALLPLLCAVGLLTATAAPATGAQPGSPDAAGQSGSVVRTDHGLVRGVSHGSYTTFDGIPYAAPPTGPLRWRAPAPAAPWPGVREATAPAQRCVQMPAPNAPGVVGSEDCLYLNVTTPTAKPRGKKRPVLVWMHGGAFLGGSGGDYSTERLAVRGDTVVVTVNYRLGIFGYFGHPGLGSAPPFGLADQQAALRWVRANAERFGGDPGSVTLFGESAGALSICAHLTSPTAAGLFQRAVLQSGSCLMSFPRGALGPGTPEYKPFASQSDVQASGADAARQLGCAEGGDEALACLRGQSTDRLATAQLMQSFNRPAYGNPLLPVAPDQALASGRFHRVPVIQGTNHDEMRMFVGLTLGVFPIRTEDDYRARLTDAFGPAAPAVEAQYPAADHPTPALAWAAVLTDRSLTCTTLAASRAIAARAPGLPLYGYEFNDQDAPVLAGLPPNPGFPYGAAHGFEMPFLFSSFPTERPLTDAQRALSDRMVDYWTNFARTGNPNTPDAPRWPLLRPASPLAPQTVQSLAPGPGAIHPVDAASAHHCSFWDRLPQ